MQREKENLSLLSTPTMKEENRLGNYFLNTGVSNITCRQRCCKGLFILDTKLPGQAPKQLFNLQVKRRRVCCSFMGAKPYSTLSYNFRYFALKHYKKSI